MTTDDRRAVTFAVMSTGANLAIFLSSGEAAGAAVEVVVGVTSDGVGEPQATLTSTATVAARNRADRNHSSVETIEKARMWLILHAFSPCRYADYTSGSTIERFIQDSRNESSI